MHTPRLLPSVFLGFLAAAPSLSAQSTWSGGGADTDWSTAGNWSGGVAPTSSSTTDLVFTGSLYTTATLAAPWYIRDLTFDGDSGNFVIGGELLTVLSNGTISAQAGSHEFTNSVTFGAAGNINAKTGAEITFSGDLSGVVSINTPAYLYGANDSSYKGTVTLTGQNSGLGGLSVYGGTLQIGDGVTSGMIGGADVFLQYAELKFNVAAGDEITIAQNIYGQGSLTKDGAGTLTLSGERAFTGNIRVNAGTLVADHYGSFGYGTGNRITYVNGASSVLRLSETFTSNYSGYFRDYEVSDGGTISVAGEFRVNEASFYDAFLVIENGGQVRGGSNTGYRFYGTSQLTASSAGAITGGEYYFYENSLLNTTTAGAVTGGTFYFHGAREITFAPGVFAAGYVYLEDTTYATLAVADVFKGTPPAEGSWFDQRPYLYVREDAQLTISAAGAMNYAGLDVQGSAQVSLNATGALVDSYLNLQDNAVVTLGADEALSNSTLGFAQWEDNGGSGGTLELNGHSLTVTRLTSTSYDSDVSHEGRIQNTAAPAVTFTVNAAMEQDSYFAGQITNSGGGAISLVKSGSGAFYLDHPNNDYTGPTTVNAGTLLVNGAITASAITVNSGGTLGGAGSVADVMINTGGALSPGEYEEEAGTFSANNVTFATGTSIVFDLTNATGGAGTGWDLLSVSNALALPAGGSITLQILAGHWQYIEADDNWVWSDAPTNFNASQNYAFTFATAGSITGFAANLFTIDDGGNSAFAVGTWSITQNGNDLVLNYTASAIPEPSTYAALAGVLALGLAAWRRRQRTA